jgi:hypothetical protein
LVSGHGWKALHRSIAEPLSLWSSTATHDTQQVFGSHEVHYTTRGLERRQADFWADVESWLE